MEIDENGLETLAAEILGSKKYRGMGLNPETVEDVLRRELATHRRKKDALHAARQKLHNIVAPYLGDPDYEEAQTRLEEIPAGSPLAAFREWCAWILEQHASTAERLPVLETFYAAVFGVIGCPKSILDLACGLNPFALPWMDLPRDVKYHAYDIHAPRLELIRRFIEHSGIAGEIHQQDVLVQPVEEKADAAFFFKEAHRFEQRQHGSNAAFWDSLPVGWLVVSLPASGLSGRNDLSAGHRSLVYNITGRRGWPVTELQVGSEMIFCIDKSGESSVGEETAR